MRFNELGDLTGGVAGGVLSINRIKVGDGGGPKWRDRDRMIANEQVGGRWGLYEHRRADNWAPTLLDERGATTFACGNGDYIVTLESRPYVTYGKLGRFEAAPADPFIRCHALDGGFDGTLIVVNETYDDLAVMWGSDGKVEHFAPVGGWFPDTVRAVVGGFLYATGNRGLWFQPRGGQLRQVAICDGAFNPGSFVDRDGVRWFYYHNEATYLHREGSPNRGYQFAGSYGPDVWYDSVTHAAKVALTPSAGELPETISIETVLLSLGEMPIGPPEELRIPKIDRFNHPVLVATFKGAGPGCTIAADEIGVFTEDFPDISNAINQAERTHDRVTWCRDGEGVLELPAGLRPRVDQVWREFYRVKTESLAVTRERCRNQTIDMLAQWSGVCGIVPMLYRQAKEDKADPRGWSELWTEQEVLDLLDILAPLVNLSPRIQVVAPFAYNRENGIVKNPSFGEALRRIVAATPGRPIFVPVIPPVVPPVIPPVVPPVVPPIEEPDMPLPKVVSFVTREGYVNVDSTNDTDHNVSHAKAKVEGDELFDVLPHNDAGRVSLRHRSTKRFLSENEFGELQTRRYPNDDPKHAGADEGFVSKGPYVFSDHSIIQTQGHPFVAPLVLLACDEQGKPLFR